MRPGQLAPAKNSWSSYKIGPSSRHWSAGSATIPSSCGASYSSLAAVAGSDQGRPATRYGGEALAVSRSGSTWLRVSRLAAVQRLTAVRFFTSRRRAALAVPYVTGTSRFASAGLPAKASSAARRTADDQDKYSPNASRDRVCRPSQAARAGSSARSNGPPRQWRRRRHHHRPLMSLN
jgi:hypothetical protein